MVRKSSMRRPNTRHWAAKPDAASSVPITANCTNNCAPRTAGTHAFQPGRGGGSSTGYHARLKKKKSLQRLERAIELIGSSSHERPPPCVRHSPTSTSRPAVKGAAILCRRGQSNARAGGPAASRIVVLRSSRIAKPSGENSSRLGGSGPASTGPQIAGQVRDSQKKGIGFRPRNSGLRPEHRRDAESERRHRGAGARDQRPCAQPCGHPPRRKARRTARSQMHAVCDGRTAGGEQVATT